jgi:hypothetical protein
MSKLYFGLLSFLIVSGCTKRVVFEPNNLPSAHVGQLYSVPISITGGTGPIVDLTYEIIPASTGIKLIFDKKKYYTEYIYNNFTIEGKPRFSGVIKIQLKGGMVASAGEIFKKSYTINVTE